MKLSKPFVEASREAGRVILLSIIPVLITQIETNVFDLRIIGVVGLLAFLRWVDKYLHELGKAKEDPKLTKGLTRF